MSACGRVQHSYRPRRWQLVALVLLLVTGSAQQLLDGYARDLIGRRLTRNAPASVVRPNGIATAFTYDYAGRLTVVEHADGPTMLARYLSGLDENGNRETVSISGTAVTTGTESYTYDALDRLTQAAVGGSTVDYAYSGDDLRTSRTENIVTESYLWDRLSALPTMVSDGATTSIHGPTGITNEITGTTASYALTDGLGSARAWTNSSGVATGATDWDVWGMTRSTSGATGLHGYTGERADPTTNLVYLRARDYSPGTARFVQPDPIQPNAEGTHGYNPYWYANANPASP